MTQNFLNFLHHWLKAMMWYAHNVFSTEESHEVGVD
jgi:hypothetical protein